MAEAAQTFFADALAAVQRFSLPVQVAAGVGLLVTLFLAFLILSAVCASRPTGADAGVNVIADRKTLERNYKGPAKAEAAAKAETPANKTAAAKGKGKKSE